MKGLSFRLKWPNDILLGSGVGPDWTGRKICGTLTEAIWQGNTFRSAIVGIGVNVRQQSFEGPLASLATSFNLVGLDISVNEVRDRILDRLEADLTRYSSLGLRQAREEIIHSLRSEFGWMWDGPPMKVSVGISQAMRGMHFEGISDTGALLLRSPEGNLITLHSGSIEPEAGMKSAGLAQDRSEAA